MQSEYPEGAVKVLDHGFVKLVDHMGDDSSIVQAARVSYGKGTKQVNEDRGLIRYLLRHAHTTPFEMVEFKFHCKMPIFVARQWIRHRTASVNEVSARYSEMKDEFWLPENEVWNQQSTVNKQGSSSEIAEYSSGGWSPTNIVGAEEFVVGKARKAEEVAFDEYKRRLENGVSKEQARSCLPVSTYTEWYWKIDLHNLFHFLRLRLDSHAQYEIRVFGEAMATMVKEKCPLAWEAFEDYKLNAMTLSGLEVARLKSMLKDATAMDRSILAFRDSYVFENKREEEEFNQKLKKLTEA